MPGDLIAILITTLVVVTHAEPPLNIGLGDLGVGDGSYSSAGPDLSYGVPSGGPLGDGGFQLGDSSGLGGYSDASSSGGFSDGGYSSGGSSFGGSGPSGGYSSGKGEIVATPAGKGVKYAGPIVYTNEKPPVIHFPPPPKPKKGSGGYGKGGKGKGSKAHSIKYVPLPHHELPILIYQSDINPPIHVVSPPAGAFSDASQVSYGPPQGDYGAPSAPVVDYGVPQGKVVNGGGSSLSLDYGAPASQISYGAPDPQISYGSPDPQISYGVPDSQISYGAPSSSQSSFAAVSSQGQSYGAPSSPSQSYGAPSSHGQSSFGSSGSHGQSSFGASASQGQVSYGAPASPQASYGAPSGSYEIQSQSQISYGPPQSEYGPPKGSFQSGPIKGDFDSIPSKGSHGPPSGAYGPPKKASPLPHIIYTGHPPIHIFQQPPIYMSAPSKASTSSIKASNYSPPPPKASGKGHGHGHGSKSKGHSKGEHGLHSLHSSIHNHLKSAFSSFHSSLPSFKASIHAGHNGHSTTHSFPKASKAKANYVVAPKGWNKPPIIIYQGVRPPVTVYEKPAGISGGYETASSISSPVSAPVTVIHQHHTVSPASLAQPIASPILLEGPIALDHTHVAGTDAPGNPSAHNVDITYGIQRSSPEAGTLVDANNYKGQFATRSIWISNYPTGANSGDQPALYVSDLTSGQPFQVIRRSDILDETILSGVSALKAELQGSEGSSESSKQQLGSSHERVERNTPFQGAQTRIEVLPTFLSTANDKTLGTLPASYNSVIVPSAGTRSGSSSLTDPSTESASKSS